MQANLIQNATPYFRILSDEQVYAVHNAVLETLEYTGVRFYHDEARGVLRDAGCRVGDDGIVKIPAWLVQQALATVPKRWNLYDRDGNNPLRVERNHVYWGTGVTCPFTLDVYTGERRPTTVADIARHTKLTDALPNYDWMEPLGQAQDVPAEVCDVYEFEAYVNNTTKPVIFITVDSEGIEDVFRMAAAARGSADDLVARPFIVQYSEPTSPLFHTEEAVAKLITTARLGIPLLHSPCVMAGATGPVTLPGTLTVALAECLSGLVLAQQLRPGLPYIIGGVLSCMDLSTTICAYGAPELSIMMAMLGDMARYYELPTFGTAGCSDSKLCDEQAAIESTLSIVFNALAGLTFVHDSGFLENGMVASADVLTMNDEVIGMVRHIMRGTVITPETLAIDVIRKQGPQKNYLETEHTLKHFREQLWMPTLLDRNVRAKWEALGRKPMRARVNEKTRSILESHQPRALPEPAAKEVARIREESHARRAPESNAGR